MLIAHLDNSGNIDGIGEATDLYPDVSFPADGPDAEWMTENNVVFVYDNPPFNPVTQVLIASSPYVLVVDGVTAVYLNIPQDLTPEQIAADLAVVMHNVSMQRNQYINKTNWTQIADSGLTSDDVTAWATFRLAVRQVCQDFMDSNREVAPVWPTPPQDVDDYVLAFLSKGNVQTPGGDAPPPPAPPAPTPPPPPAVGGEVMTAAPPPEA